MIETLCTGSAPGQRQRHERVAHLVIGDDLALLRIEQAVALLQAGDDALDRVVEVGHRHRVGAAARGEQRRLVDEVGEVGAGEAGRQRRDLLRRRRPARASPSSCAPRRICDAALLVRPVDQHLPVEAAGAQQRRVEDLGPVGRAEQHEAGARIEAVELDQELVQRLLLLVVAAGRRAADAAGAAERVELVDEDDGRRLARAPARTGRARAPRRRRRTSPRTRSRRSRRTAPWPRRPPPWRAASCRCRAGRPAARPSASARRGGRTRSGFLQEIDDLAQLVLRLVDAGDVVEGDAGVGLDIDLGLRSCRSPSARRRAAAPCGGRGRPRRRRRAGPAGPRRGCRAAACSRSGPCSGRCSGRAPAAISGSTRVVTKSVLPSERLLERALDEAVGDADLRDLAVAQQLLELAVGDGRRLRCAVPWRRIGWRGWPTKATTQYQMLNCVFLVNWRVLGHGNLLSRRLRTRGQCCETFSGTGRCCPCSVRLVRIFGPAA